LTVGHENTVASKPIVATISRIITFKRIDAQFNAERLWPSPR
jgi:hypothetical protein